MTTLPILNKTMSTEDFAARVAQKLRKLFSPPEQFLRRATGVIHVGANTGQEREIYARYNLPVIWIEPIPTVFATLQSNIQNFPRQIAYERLIAEEDGALLALNISSNGGESSSIFKLGRHQELWPEVHFTNSIELKSITLKSFVAEENVDLKLYNTLILDTQGSELMILKGAVDVLSSFLFVKTEVADFDSYIGCCKLVELDQFMREHQFDQKRRDFYAGSKDIGRYYDVLYQHRS